MDVADLDELLEIAVAVARSAGDLLLDGLPRARTSVRTKSSRTDMVTDDGEPVTVAPKKKKAAKKKTKPKNAKKAAGKVAKRSTKRKSSMLRKQRRPRALF